MRSGSITLLSLAAFGASLTDGAAIPQDVSTSPASSRRSSVQSTTMSSTSSSTVASSTASSSSTAKSTSTPAAGPAVRPVFYMNFGGGATTTQATSSSLTIDPLAKPTSPTTSHASSTTSSSSPVSPTSTRQSIASSTAIAQSSSALQGVVSSSTRRSSSLLNPTLITTSLPPTSTSSFSTTRRSSVSPTTASPTTSSSLPRNVSTSTSMSRSSSSHDTSPSLSSIAMTRSASTTALRTSSTTSLSARSETTTSRSTNSAQATSAQTTVRPVQRPVYQAVVANSPAALTSSTIQATSTQIKSKAVPSLVPSGTVSSSIASQAQSKVASSQVAASASASTVSTGRLSSTTASTRASSAIPSANTASTLFRPTSSVISPRVVSSAIASTTAPSSSVAPGARPSAASRVQVKPIDFGCWYDTTDNRTLKGPSYTSSTSMTKEACSTFCTSHNMPFSGTEYGEECYCSETAPTSAAAWWCNMPCTGDGSEICGSGNALSVTYMPPTSSSPTTSTAIGCFADSSELRTMKGPSFTSSSMTNEACASFCTIEGYQYSGTEYASQCFCSNDAPWSAQVGCSMSCPGDSSEICGDGNALSITKTTNGTLTTASVATLTPASNSSNTKIDLNQKFESWSTWKARGINLGNWLVLEQWMYPTWFDNTAPGAVDEWTFCESLGKEACATALQQHWSTFIGESDIQQMSKLSTNTLRIPIGFWAFVDPIAGEPYIRSTQLQELKRVLGYASEYGMTVVLDIHGLPGSQNGKDHSGHAGSVEFYTAANQARSLAAVQAAASWIASSGYAGAVISSLEVANEPAIADWTTWLQYKDYVLAAHAIVQSTVPSVSTMFHDGFWPLAPWNQFFKEGDNAVIDTHKYWAFSATTLEQAESDVCAYVDAFASINIPVFVGEFSLSVAADVSSFVGYAVGFFESQMSVWLKAAGAAFWSVKVMQDNGEQNPAWSAQSILSSGAFSNVNVWNFDQAAC